MLLNIIRAFLLLCLVVRNPDVYYFKTSIRLVENSAPEELDY